MGKSKSAPIPEVPDLPDPPDYAALARQQAELDERGIARNIWANRPNQVTPWGSTNWEASLMRDPATGRNVTNWTQTQNLDPQLQAAMDAQFGLGQNRSELAGGMFGGVEDAYGTPWSTEGVRGIADVQDPLEFRQRAEDAAYDQFRNRADRRYGESEEALQSRLLNQGLRPGDEAYDAEMRRFDESKTDAYQTAANAAVAAGLNESQTLYGQGLQNQAQSAQLREQQIQELLRDRNIPLSEINNLVSGQDIQDITQPGFASTGAVARGPDLVGAAGNQFNAQMQNFTNQYQSGIDAYNAREQQRQSRNSGISNLVSAGLGMFSFPSDRRLKTNIVQIGTWRGYPLYHYDYIWGESAVGVMSDEINQDAVVKHPSGYDFVDYSRVRA